MPGDYVGAGSRLGSASRTALRELIPSLVDATRRCEGGSPGPLLRLVRLVQRPGRQRLAAAEITSDSRAGVTEMDVATFAQLVRETAEHHDGYEKAAPPHDWWDWHAPYLSAREHDSTLEQASAAADRYMQEVRGVVVSR